MVINKKTYIFDYIYIINQIMIKVNVKNGNIDKALRFLKRKVRNTKQTNELRERKTYTKPTEERRESKKKAIYIEQKRIKDEDI